MIGDFITPVISAGGLLFLVIGIAIIFPEFGAVFSAVFGIFSFVLTDDLVEFYDFDVPKAVVHALLICLAVVGFFISMSCIVI